MKKIISMLLVIAMMITFVMPVIASSDTSAEKGLENAIKAVKGKINIPKECNKFTYNIFNQNGAIAWNLGWSNEEIQKYINVTIDENNLITSYNSYQYSSYEKKIPKYSKQQGQEIAEKFINNLDAKLLPQFKLVENNNNYYPSDREYYFNYVRQVNNINYTMNNISININMYTGEINNYNCGYSKNTTFEDATKIISLEQAKKAFIEKLGLKMVYNFKTDNEKTVPYLAYIPKDSNKYIDAITGEIETANNHYGPYYDGYMMSEKLSSAAGGNVNVVLTPDEIDAIKGMSDIIPKEEADKKIRAIKLFNLDNEFILSNSDLSKDWRNKDTLVWSLRYTKLIDKDTKETREVQVSIDAKSGDIINFWSDYPSVEGAKPLKTKEEAKVICEAILKDLIPSNYAKVKFDDTEYNNYDQSQNQFTFRYVRVENGLECPNDYITIAYDNLSGNVNSVNSNWTNGVKFEDPKQTISIDKAYDVLFNKIGYNIQYINDSQNNVMDKMMPYQLDSGKAVLGYFINTNIPNIISATTGEILNYSGTEYKATIISDYTDIKGIYAENQVKILTQLSIKYKENELKANDNLLQKDYFLILSRLNDLFYLQPDMDDDKAIEQMYNGLISQGIITKAEKAPMATLTREEAAKYFIKFLKYGQIAEIKGIYKSNFKDTNKINPDLIGYVSLASGLKAMNGNKGYFYPKNKITRLEGLLSIYSYLSNK